MSGSHAVAGGRRARLTAVWLLAALAAAAVVLGSGRLGRDSAQATVDVTAAGTVRVQRPPAVVPVSTSDASAQANQVAAEDRRLTTVQTAAQLARWQNRNWKTPWRLSSGTSYTLVLVPRATAYTVEDLLKLAPQTFLRLTDGSFLLTENLAVLSGATLSLTNPGGLTLRLASSAEGFVSIVSFGGRLDFEGTPGHRMRLTSWDPGAATPDLRTTDGRAYVRAVGGQVRMRSVDLHDLGFWSGRTGGLALTGTDRPDTGNVQSTRKAARSPSQVPTISDGLPANPVLPAGRLPVSGSTGTALKYTTPLYSYVSCDIGDTTIDGDAFGLFASGVSGLQLTDTTVRNSLITGIVMHRYVTSAVLERVTSEHNVGDGFNVDRASQGIVISESTAAGNSARGFLLSGRPLADGPSATGSSTASYGNNTVSNSSALGNGGTGIEVLGGFNVGVTGNHVSANATGISVTRGASRVSVTGNQVSGSSGHGIALTNAVTASTVTGNIVTGATTGIYLRDSSAMVGSNTVTRATGHGISLVGHVRGSTVSDNALAGHGQSAYDMARSLGSVHSSDNVSTGWHDTSPWYVSLKRLLHPMTLLWGAVLALVLLGAVRSRRSRRTGNLGRPYASLPPHRDGSGPAGSGAGLAVLPAGGAA